MLFEEQAEEEDENLEEKDLMYKKIVKANNRVVNNRKKT
jgi:hypothetical protein